MEGLRAMARGFRNFVDVLTTDPQGTASEVLSADNCDLVAAELLDSWPEKLSAWRAAMYVSCVVLQTDLEVIGTSSKSKPGKSPQQLGRLVVGHL